MEGQLIVGTHVSPGNTLLLPEAPLRYLGRMTDDLFNATEDMKTKGLSYQWPVSFPNNRWKLDKNLIQLSKNSKF